MRTAKITENIEERYRSWMPSLIAATLTFVLVQPVQAETLGEHAQSCVDELRMDYADGIKVENWKIPDIDCRDGVVLPTSLFGEECDAEAQLRGINHTSQGRHNCLAGARLGRLDVPNEDVKAVYICRKDPEYNEQPDGEPVDDYFHDIAMIITNASIGKPESGKTCFFQNGFINGKIGPHVASPQAGSSSWQWPSRTGGAGGGNCIACHGSDPFIVTPHVAGALSELGVLPSLNLMGPYSIVGEDFLPVDANGLPTDRNWNLRIQQHRDQEQGCSAACHYGTSPTLYDPLNLKALEQGWMGPGETTTWTHALYDTLERTGPAQQYNRRIIVWSDFNHPDRALADGEGIPWRWHQGPTPTANAGMPTGPYGANDQYLYVETSKGEGMFHAGSFATAETRSYDFSNSVLSFDYVMYGADIGTLEIQMASHDQWVIVGEIPADNQFGWQSYSLDISEPGMNFGPTKVRLRYNAAGGHRGDIAIDNFLIIRKE